MKLHLLVVALLGCAMAAQAQTPPGPNDAPALRKASAPLPFLKKTGPVTQLIVDGKPFVMLSGELHNSSASSTEYMKPIWNKLAALHLNTVIGTVSWELLEPEEGKFDFNLVDYQLQEARRHDMRLVLIWFASWKNANSSYAPLWVKANLERFPRIQTKDGRNQEELTPLGDASLAGDAKAFRALMRHIRQADPQHTVVMMQVENETGMLGDSRDRSPLAEAAWNKPVPAELMNYLLENRQHLLPELGKVWEAGGFKSSGTWPEVFGSDPHSAEIFMAWYVGRYVGKVAEAGKSELALPMYANAWLVQRDDQLPGGYPSGGPVSRVLDVWRAAAPRIDLLAPDIYLPDFKGVCASYTRSGNPLFIPEARASAANLFWAVGQHAALGYSPFGIENLNEDNPLGEAYEVLGNMIPVLAKYLPQGKVLPVLQGDENSQSVAFGGYRLEIGFPGRRPPGQPALPQSQGPQAPQAQETKAFGLFVNTAPDEFLVVGSGLQVAFRPDSPGPGIAAIGTVDEGRYAKGQWIPGRRLNGDETGGGVRLMLRGPRIGLLKVKVYRHD
ncbi:MAG TPA: DUF5597 domain-containing protein [Bryobacteraceae bacterium]|nr:DUF5597 domain-containing protein [Bryobacteraceae bacterium]